MASMDLSDYVEELRRHLTAAAAAGTEQTQQTARLLAETLEPAVRLALTDALSAMAAEVTAAWDGGLVDIRVRGRDLEVVVVPAPQQEPVEPAGDGAARADAGEDDGSVSRISLRLPESLKSSVERAAAAEGVSTNTWLVRAIARATESRPVHVTVGKRLSGYAQS